MAQSGVEVCTEVWPPAAQSCLQTAKDWLRCEEVHPHFGLPIPTLVYCLLVAPVMMTGIPHNPNPLARSWTQVTKSCHFCQNQHIFMECKNGASTKKCVKSYCRT